MDKSHANFMRVMKDDPSVDNEALHNAFPKNYSDTLRLKDLSTLKRISKRAGTQRNFHDIVEEEKDDSLENAKMDNFDRKMLKEGRLDFIGVNRRVDTNLHRKIPDAEELEPHERPHNVRLGIKIRKLLDPKEIKKAQDAKIAA